MQRKKHAVHIFAAHGGIHDGGRKRMGNRIARHPIDLRGRVHLVNAINASKLLRGHLSGSSLLVYGERAEDKSTARTDTQDTANDSLLPHAESHQTVRILVL